jgi:hypothetical protein
VLFGNLIGLAVHYCSLPAELVLTLALLIAADISLAMLGIVSRPVSQFAVKSISDYFGAVYAMLSIGHVSYGAIQPLAMFVMAPLFRESALIGEGST